MLDALNIQKCSLIGSCIGPSYQLRLLRDYPDRFNCAVLLQPIGLAVHTTENQRWNGPNTDATEHWYFGWAREMERAGRATKEEVTTLHDNMFGPPLDHVFSVSRADIANIRHPMLVCAGVSCCRRFPLPVLGPPLTSTPSAPQVDLYHPAQTARDIVAEAPGAEFIEDWHNGPGQPRAQSRVVEFFARHAGLREPPKPVINFGGWKDG